MQDADLIRIVLAFVSADSWDKWEQLVRMAEQTLLSQEADLLLEQMMQEAPESDPLRTTMELRRALLRRCRENGIEAAFAHLRGPITENGEDVTPPAALKKLEQMQQMGDPDDPEETMMHPDMVRGVVLRGVLQTYDSMLETQRGTPLDYSQTQLNRARVLHQLAGLRGEDRPKRLHEALVAYNDVLAFQQDAPRDYALTQSNRAILLYQLAVLPKENHINRLREALEAYDNALEHLHDVPHFYCKTQLHRVALLRDMAGLAGENRARRLYQALEGLNKALELQQERPLDYARTQLPRANLLRELAGLQGENRASRMVEALAAYDEVLVRLESGAAEYALTQINRTSLLQEIGDLPGEDHTERLRQALAAAVEALSLLQPQGENSSAFRTAQRMVKYTCKNIIDSEGTAVFNRWWEEIAAMPQPDWLENSAGQSTKNS